MATYGQRDKFLQAVVTFTTSDQAKELPATERQELLIKIRDKYAPDISNAEWGEIAKGINDFKFVITDTVKYGEVPNIESQLPEKEPEVNYQKTQNETPHLDESLKENAEEEVNEDNKIDAEELDDSEEFVEDDNSDAEDEEGATKDDDYTEDEKPREPEPPKPEAKVFGKFTKPKEIKPNKVSTSKLRGLLKPKK